MSLKQKLEADFKNALKARDELKTSCLRLIKAAIQNKEIDQRGELQETQIFLLLSTLSKQRQESIEMYKKGGRNDLAEKESQEQAILEAYLPKPLTEGELSAMVQSAIAEAEAKSPQDMGKVMKLVMPKVAGRADGKKIQELVKEKLK